MRISGVDIRPGMVLEHEGKLWRVLKTQWTQPGKGGAFNQVEMKSLTEGTKTNIRFRSADTVEKAALDVRPMQYLFGDDASLTLMDPNSFEQVTVSRDMVGDSIVWLTENMTLTVEFYGDTPMIVNLPPHANWEVTMADPVVKGQTASGSFKTAQLANGQRVQVPTYIENGVVVIVNTADGTFVGRA
jgi:elongation factor P